tara:strand:+ start:1500 stop:2360 length:861 start_codon:yes stop_codon:yes gene_type:complete
VNIICTGNFRKNKFLPILNDLILLFESYNEHTLYLDNCLKVPENNKYLFDDIYLPNNAIDFVICIGGDGAILSAINRMKEKQIPILGIHIGNLGFLNKMNSTNYRNFIETIFKNNSIDYDNKCLIESSFSTSGNKKNKLTGFNELFIRRTELSRLLSIEVYINDEFLNNYSCDGLIISTPMGSTAYSLSAGGPIVSPSVNCIIITPVSPHTLSSRPIIINDSYKVTVKPHFKDDEVTIFSDGQSSFKIKNNTSIKISKSNVRAKLISFINEDSYYKKLRDNLGWNI